MKNKGILSLFITGALLIACTPAKQTGKDFQWGELPQQPDLSWVDSVGSRQEPINHITLSANSLGAVADSTVLSTTAIQKAIDSCAVSGGGTVTLQPGYYQTGALFIKSGVTGQSSNSPLSGIPFKSCRNRNDMAIGSYQYHR